MTKWLIDKSALVRLPGHPKAVDWFLRIQRGLVQISTITKLEVGYSARLGSQFRDDLDSSPLADMPVEYLTIRSEERSIEVLTLLADRGQHRAPSIPDLLIAACAEIGGLTILACDKDFSLIAQITGQPVDDLDGPVFRT